VEVKIRLEGGRHWHFQDCELAQDPDYIEVPLMEVLAGNYNPVDGNVEVVYKLCPGCQFMIKSINITRRTASCRKPYWDIPRKNNQGVNESTSE